VSLRVRSTPVAQPATNDNTAMKPTTLLLNETAPTCSECSIDLFERLFMSMGGVNQKNKIYATLLLVRNRILEVTLSDLD
jgi:hypothetical protein